MIDRLVQELAATRHIDLDVDQILDVLWLAAAGPRRPAELAGADDSATPAPMETGAPPNDEPTLAPKPDPAAEPQPEPGPGRVPVYTDGRPEAGDDAPATVVGFDAPRPRQRIATPQMAVRRLRKVVAPGRHLVVDIDATVEATAEASGPARSLLMPVLARPPQPALDLALVVDDAPSMGIWDEEFDDLLRLLAQTHAFRSTSRWRFTPGEGVIRPYTRRKPGHDPGPEPPPQRPEQLVDSSTRRLVLVATDARDQSWYDDAPWDAINTWCGAAPTALIHVLPPQYWADTAVGIPYVTSRALTPAAPNRQHKHQLVWWAEDDDPPGQQDDSAEDDRPRRAPLPVVALAEEPLDVLARSIVNGTAWVEGVIAAKPDIGAPQSADADAAVNGFLAKATPGALRLARILASTGRELPMPLISVLAERLAPETGVAELAEIMACGLLEYTGYTDDTGHQVLRFREDTRSILYRGTTAFEDWDALTVVSKYFADLPRLGGPVQVKVADPAGSAQRDPNEKPSFAVEHELAVRLGLRSPAPALVEAGDDSFPRDRQLVTDPDRAKRPDDRTGDTAALRAALAAEIRKLDEGDEVRIAVFGPDGIAVWRVIRDEKGTPQARPSVLAAGPVTAPEDFYTQRLGPSVGDGRLLIAVGGPDESQGAVLSLLRAARGAPVFDCHERFDDLLGEVIGHTPLTRPYDLIVLTEGADGQLEMGSWPLIPREAASGYRSPPFTVRCAPADDRGSVFAVVARGPRTEPFLLDRKHVVQVQSVVLPGTYQATALLSRPGQVEFDGLPAPRVREDQSLAQLIRQIPQRLLTAAPVHLLCLVEVGGDGVQLRHRIDRLEELIAVAEAGGRPLAVSVISYGAHAVMRGMHEEPATVQAWATTPYEAIFALRGLLGREVPDPRQEYQRAAQIECALDEVSRWLTQDSEDSGRLVVVTAGGRPPHPPRVDLYTEIIPCPKRLNSQELTARLQENPGIKFGALCDPGVYGAIWLDLGRDAFAATDVVDVNQFARLLDLQEPVQALPFPLLAATGQAPGPRPRNAARLGGIAMLGSPGSGKSTFLSALNVTLQWRGQAPGGWMLETQRNNPVKSGIGTATTPLELVTQLALVQHGAQGGQIAHRDRPGEVARRSSTKIALNLVDPEGELWSAQPRPQRQEVIKEVSDTYGILYLFDPMREFKVGDTYSAISRIISQVSQETASGHAHDFDGTLRHHVAVCVMKFDEPRVLATARRMGVVTTDPEDPYGFPRVRDSDARRVFAKLCNGDGEMVLDTLDRTFRSDRVRYFVTSAIGFRTDPGTGRFDPADPQNVATPPPGAAPTELRLRGPINPINVVEPVLWLAEQIART